MYLDTYYVQKRSGDLCGFVVDCRVRTGLSYGARRGRLEDYRLSAATHLLTSRLVSVAVIKGKSG